MTLHKMVAVLSQLMGSNNYKIAILASMLSIHEKKQIITGSFRDNSLVESRSH
jgi:hypothetical protein